MASMDINLAGQNSEKLVKSVKLCAFCNNSTNGFDKWLHGTEQDKGPFFPVLADIGGEDTVVDELGRTLVCIACFHHLLRQWNSYERRCIPVQKRQYNLIAAEKLSNFQIKREEEIRKEGEFKLKEIKLREERIKKEAKERLEVYRQKEQKIIEDAEQRLVQEEEELEAIRREAARQLKEEQAHEEELKQLLEEQIRLEKQKGDYIRKEAERLLREEKLLSSTQPPVNVRTEVLIHSPQGRAFDQITSDYYLNENKAKTTKQDKEEDTMEPRRSRTMEYDPVTGCYVRKVPLDFSDKKVEDIVKEELKKSEEKEKLFSGDKERGSTADTSLVDLSLRTSDRKVEKSSLPYYASGGMEIEYQFTVKEGTKTESSPAGFEENGVVADEDSKKAGEAVKGRFDGDRKKSERYSEDVVMSETSKRSFERRRRSEDDPDSKKARDDIKERSSSLDKRLKDMEERRARLFKGTSEEKPDKSEVTITRTVTTETSYSSPASENSMFGERMQDAHRRHRNREERIRRRRDAEELLANKSTEKPKSSPMKSTGVKLELRGSAFGRKEDSSAKSGSGSIMDEPNAFSGSSYSYHGKDEASEITYTVKKTTETKKDDDNTEELDKKETTFDWKEKQQKSSSKTTETTNTSLMDEPIVWSQPGSGYLGRGTDDDISFTVKETSTKKDDADDDVKREKEEKRESTRNRIIETEVKVEESKPVQNLFSSDFGQDEPQDIVFSVKETSTPSKRSTTDGDIKDSDTTKSKPKELTLERGAYDEKYSFKSSSNSDLLRWEMDNTDSGKKSSEPETGDTTDGYKGSLRRSNAVGRVGSFNRGRDDLPAAIFHDIESDTPANPQLEMRNESPSPGSRDSSLDTTQSPVLLTQLQDESIDDERRRKRQEIEEKKRRIAESQKKANVQLRRDVSENKRKKEEAAAEPGKTDSIEDLSEKRRSLLMMWESYAEGEGPGPENHEPQEKSEREPFGYDVMMMEASQSDPNAAVIDYRTMDAEDEKEETRAPLVDIDEYHKLNDDELRWERAGQFQPGKLKTKFHEIPKDEPSYETKKSSYQINNNTADVSLKIYREQQRFNQRQVEEDQSYADETTEVESAPKPLWDESQGQTTSKSDDEDEDNKRKPHVDVDEVYRMTEEEARWEKVGQFQPGKINNSIFESKLKTDKTERPVSPNIQRREQSRYEQIKKIQRTDSKKELLVPKKVALRSDRQEDDLQEEDERDRPLVGKIDTHVFHGTVSEDERQRQEREARNRRDIEEIQREKEEERRREERENLESKRSVNEFEDDEFDVKVKSRDVGKIDINKFSDFQKSSEGIPDVQPVSKGTTKRYVSESRRDDRIESVRKTTTYRGQTEEDNYDKVRHKSVGKLSTESSPFIQHDTKETNKPRKVQERTLSPTKKEIVAQEISLEMASPPSKYGEDEFDNMTRARSVKKLDVSRFSFSRDDKYQENRQEVDNKTLKYDKNVKTPVKSFDKTPLVEDRKREREREKREWEEQLKRERDQIEQIKLAHDWAYQDYNVKGGNETNDNDNNIRNIRKLDLSVFSKFQQGDAGRKTTVRKTSDGKRGYVQENETVVTQTAMEVESASVNQYEEDEYEMKRRSVGKLNKDWLSQAKEQEAKDAELRRKESEIERIRKEQYEIEMLRMEEEKRREFERDEVPRDESDLKSDKPQSVKKLDSNTMSPFLKGGRPTPDSSLGPRKKNKDEVRQERKLARKESRGKLQKDEVLYVEETEDVQQSPESFDDRPKDVGRLNTGRYLQMMGEDLSEKERRKKVLEEERMRLELEEMEKQREEEARRKEMDGRDDTTSSSSSDKPQNVNKLDLTQFSKFQQETVVMAKKPKNELEIKYKKEHIIAEESPLEKANPQDKRDTPLVPESGENDWLEKERSEALMYEEKRQNVGRLDVSRFIQTRSEEEQDRHSKIKELERKRIKKEKEEMERLKEENKVIRDVALDSEVSSETAREDNKTPSIQSSDSQHKREREEELTVDEKRKSGVGRLNVGQFMQSLSKEEEEKNRRKIELEKERIRREAEEKEFLRMEQQKSSEVIEISTVKEVHSAPAEDFYDRGSREEREREEEMTVEEKRKSVGRLDVDRFVQSISEEAEEKRRRKIELEKERIRRENEERELLRLEQERGRKDESISTSSIEKTNKKYVVVHREDPVPSVDQEYERKDREKYSSLEIEREEEMSVEEKRKSVGRLDVARFVQSLSHEEEEKRRRMIELEKERRRREEEEKELLRMEEQERGRGSNVSHSSVTSKSSYEHVSRKVVQGVESLSYDQADEDAKYPSRIDQEREEELSVEEKRKSVGRLNVGQYFLSLNKEEQEKRRRTIELEKERIRRENEERELLRMEQERSRNERNDQYVEQVSASVVQEVHSAPSEDIFIDEDKRASLEREREEAMSVEEKRKSVGRLDFNQFLQSLSEEDREKQMRKIELERERLRREKEEREMEEKQLRLRESYSEEIRSSKSEVVHSEVAVDYEDNDTTLSKKEVGRLDLQRFAQQIDQETRERERRARELEIERLCMEREEMEGRGGSQTVQHESYSSERRETTVIDEKRKYRSEEVDKRSEGQTESIKSDESSDSDKPVPKRLDLSKFSAFQGGSGRRTTKDDTAVKRREKSEGRQPRPKSIAGSSFGGVSNGEAKSEERVYRIIH